MKSPNTPSETGWRGSHAGWLEAGYQALIEGGVDAVKIMPLAKSLNLSRTSFYWFFEDREALLAALLQGWEERSTKPLLRAASEYAESLPEAMLNVLACFLTNQLDAKLEFAVRSWGLQDEGVASRVAEADELRHEALRKMMIHWGMAELEADVRARTIYLTQIGYISMRANEDTETRLLRIATYVEIYTGRAAEPRELARFMARVRSAVAEEK